MKVIIAGSRTFDNERFVSVISDAVFFSDFEVDEIVSGGARGIDHWGEEYARKMHIPCTVFRADWEKFGKAAGAIRNSEMAKHADALILIYDGQSRGSSNMLKQAKQNGLKVFKVVLGYEED